MAYGDNIVSISDIVVSSAQWVPGEEVTIAFKLKNVSGRKITEMSLAVTVRKRSFGGTATGNDYIFLHWILGTHITVPASISIAAGKSKAFSATFVVTDQVAQYFSENKNVRTVPINIRYSVDSTTPNILIGGDIEIPEIRAMNHRFKPQILAMELKRAKNGVTNDEGENILATLKLGVDSGGYNCAQFFTARMYQKRGDNATTSDAYIDLTSNIHELLAGVVDDPKLLPEKYSNAYNWDFLLVFGDEYEAFVGNFNLADAFANVHLSGLPTGGVCFGGFCKSQYGAPKLESHYPIRPYGGLEAVDGGIYVQELPFDSGAPFRVYPDNPMQPTLRAFGNIVEIQGEIQPTKTIAGGTAYHPICTIPERYAPEHDVVALQQGRNQNIWLLRIFGRNHAKHPCKAIFTRYRSGAAWDDAGTNAWLPFHAVWSIDGTVDSEIKPVTAALIDAEGYSVRDVEGRSVSVLSATNESYTSSYTGTQIDTGVGKALTMPEFNSGFTDKTASMYAGQLLFVDGTGKISPISLGAGLQITNGVLSVIGGGGSGGGGDSGEISFAVDENGNATISGAALTVDGNGNATIPVDIAVDAYGNASI